MTRSPFQQSEKRMHFSNKIYQVVSLQKQTIMTMKMIPFCCNLIV